MSETHDYDSIREWENDHEDDYSKEKARAQWLRKKQPVKRGHRCSAYRI